MVVGSSPSADNASTTADTLPTITINGDNPAIINVGTDYSDLGATAEEADGHSLDIATFLNGADVPGITLNTSEPDTDTIDYVATDNAGFAATNTRTIVIEAQATGSAQ